MAVGRGEDTPVLALNTLMPEPMRVRVWRIDVRVPPLAWKSESSLSSAPASGMSSPEPGSA